MAAHVPRKPPPPPPAGSSQAARQDTSGASPGRLGGGGGVTHLHLFNHCKQFRVLQARQSRERGQAGIPAPLLLPPRKTSGPSKTRGNWPGEGRRALLWDLARAASSGPSQPEVSQCSPPPPSTGKKLRLSLLGLGQDLSPGCPPPPSDHAPHPSVEETTLSREPPTGSRPRAKPPWRHQGGEKGPPAVALGS